MEKLKDKPMTSAALRVFRKVKPLRQMEFADLMVATGDYTAVYANTLLLATPSDLLVSPNKPKAPGNLKPEDVHQMEREMENLERDFRVYQDRYGENALSLNFVQLGRRDRFDALIARSLTLELNLHVGLAGNPALKANSPQIVLAGNFHEITHR